VAYRLLGRVFNEVHTVSEEVRRFCIEVDGLSPWRVRTVYNGVAISGKTESRLPRAGGPAVITMVGHIRPVKGFDVFIRTAARVCCEFPDAVFQIAGENHDAACHAGLTKLREELGIAGNVRFLGGVEDVAGLLEGSDVFCLLSRSEGLSNALLEAMGAELPCVATRVGGNSELVEDGRSGYLVDNEDDHAAAEAVMWLIRNPEKAAAMGRRGRDIVKEHFTEAAMIRQLTESYERLLLESGR